MLWEYVPDPPKPHIHPLRSPGGRILTRSHTPDHPWQRGLWFAVKFVNGENFWEEFEPFGWQRPVAGSTDTEWVRDDGSVVLDEQRRVEQVDDRTLDWTSTLVPRGDVVLDRTPFQGWGGYGGLAFRGAPDWLDTEIRTETTVGTEVLGVRSRWCDLASPDAGVLLLDHRDNPRHPVPWYGNVANPLYGTDERTNFVNAAFLWDEPLSVTTGEAVTFRYRVVVHDGNCSNDDADDAWARWSS